MTARAKRSIIVVISFLVAAIISIGFFKGIIVPLKKAQNTSAPAQEELIGVLAKVQESIPAKGYGEIAYVVNGNSFIAPAKTTPISSSQSIVGPEFQK